MPEKINVFPPFTEKEQLLAQTRHLKPLANSTIPFPVGYPPAK